MENDFSALRNLSQITILGGSPPGRLTRPEQRIWYPRRAMPEIRFLTVAVASSLSDVLPRIASAWSELGSSPQIRATSGASGTLARQIAAGAPIDVFLSAGEKEVRELLARGAARAETRVVFAGNSLVLTQLATARVRLKEFADLAHLPDGFRVALGNPDAVPAGRYARETLLKRGVYDLLREQNRLVFTGSVRQAADAVAQGNADAGLIFATDARGYKPLRVVCAARSGVDHAPIRYIAVVTRQTRGEVAAAGFVRFLRTAPARDILAGAGFTVPL